MELSGAKSSAGAGAVAPTADRRASGTAGTSEIQEPAVRKESADWLGPTPCVNTLNGSVATAASLTTSTAATATATTTGEPVVRHAKRLLVGCHIGNHTIEKCSSPKKKALDPMRYIPDRAAFYALFTIHVQFEGASDDHQVYRTYKQLGALHSRVSFCHWVLYRFYRSSNALVFFVRYVFIDPEEVPQVKVPKGPAVNAQEALRQRVHRAEEAGAWCVKAICIRSVTVLIIPCCLHCTVHFMTLENRT